MLDSETITRLRYEVEQELANNILPFWIRHAVDVENGGFYGHITNDLKVHKTADKGCILNSRILWTYSCAYRIYGYDRYLKMAQRAYEFMLKYFWDKEFSGLYWMVDYRGDAVKTHKQIYNLAFGIYGLSEYYRATGDKESLEYAVKLFKMIEEHSYDKKSKGYIEALNREWGLADDMRLSEKDMNTEKSMNTHLHILEAYTSLLRVWDNELLKNRLKELILVTIEHIIHKDTKHFKLFFDKDWNAISERVSFGHDIEGSWLLFEAATVLGNTSIINKVRSLSIEMAEKVYNEGIDLLNGGLYNEAENWILTDSDKHWWPQAEALVGFMNAYELSGEEYFFKAACNIWDFIKSHIVDKENGEWFWRVSRLNKVYFEEPKVDPWKCPYHNSRACFEVISRLDQM
jgi:cellobiose epimerase